jgi:hypothetical protein
MLDVREEKKPHTTKHAFFSVTSGNDEIITLSNGGRDVVTITFSPRECTQITVNATTDDYGLFTVK